MGTSSAVVTRRLFDEVARHVQTVLQAGVPLVDADYNDGVESFYTQMRRIVQNSIGDGAQGDAFQVRVHIDGGPVENSILIWGALSEDTGPLRLFVEGHAAGLDEPDPFLGGQATAALVTGVSTTVLFDSATKWIPGSLVGRKLIPDAGSPLVSFTIVANTEHSISIMVGSGNLATATAPNRRYRVGLSTPLVDRTDLVVLDVYLDEVSGLENPTLIHTIDSISLEAMRRWRLEEYVYVLEGVSDPSTITNYTDSDGNRHARIPLARLHRVAGNPVVEEFMIEDLRPKIFLLDQVDDRYVNESGDRMTGPLNMAPGTAINFEFGAEMTGRNVIGNELIKPDAVAQNQLQRSTHLLGDLDGVNAVPTELPIVHDNRYYKKSEIDVLLGKNLLSNSDFSRGLRGWVTASPQALFGGPVGETAGKVVVACKLCGSSCCCAGLSIYMKAGYRGCFICAASQTVRACSGGEKFQVITTTEATRGNDGYIPVVQLLMFSSCQFVGTKVVRMSDRILDIGDGCQRLVKDVVIPSHVDEITTQICLEAHPQDASDVLAPPPVPLVDEVENNLFHLRRQRPSKIGPDTEYDVVLVLRAKVDLPIAAIEDQIPFGNTLVAGSIIGVKALVAGEELVVIYRLRSGPVSSGPWTIVGAARAWNGVVSSPSQFLDLVSVIPEFVGPALPSDLDKCGIGPDDMEVVYCNAQLRKRSGVEEEDDVLDACEIRDGVQLIAVTPSGEIVYDPAEHQERVRLTKIAATIANPDAKFQWNCGTNVSSSPIRIAELITATCEERCQCAVPCPVIPPITPPVPPFPPTGRNDCYQEKNEPEHVLSGLFSMSFKIGDTTHTSFGAERPVGGMVYATPGKFQMLYRVNIAASLVVMFIDEDGHRAFYKDLLPRPAGDVGTLEIQDTAFNLLDVTFKWNAPTTLIIGIADLPGLVANPAATFDELKWIPDVGGIVLIDDFDSYGPSTERFDEKWSCGSVFPAPFPGEPAIDTCFTLCGVRECCIQAIQIISPALVAWTTGLPLAPPVDLSTMVKLQYDVYTTAGLTLRTQLIDGTGKRAGFDQVLFANVGDVALFTNWTTVSKNYPADFTFDVGFDPTTVSEIDIVLIAPTIGAPTIFLSKLRALNAFAFEIPITGADMTDVETYWTVNEETAIPSSPGSPPIIPPPVSELHTPFSPAYAAPPPAMGFTNYSAEYSALGLDSVKLIHGDLAAIPGAQIPSTAIQGSIEVYLNNMVPGLNAQSATVFFDFAAGQQLQVSVSPILDGWNAYTIPIPPIAGGGESPDNTLGQLVGFDATDAVITPDEPDWTTLSRYGMVLRNPDPGTLVGFGGVKFASGEQLNFDYLTPVTFPTEVINKLQTPPTTCFNTPVLSIPRDLLFPLLAHQIQFQTESHIDASMGIVLTGIASMNSFGQTEVQVRMEPQQVIRAPWIGMVDASSGIILAPAYAIDPSFVPGSPADVFANANTLPRIAQQGPELAGPYDPTVDQASTPAGITPGSPFVALRSVNWNQIPGFGLFDFGNITGVFIITHQGLSAGTFEVGDVWAFACTLRPDLDTPGSSVANAPANPALWMDWRGSQPAYTSNFSLDNPFNIFGVGTPVDKASIPMVINPFGLSRDVCYYEQLQIQDRIRLLTTVDIPVFPAMCAKGIGLLGYASSDIQLVARSLRTVVATAGWQLFDFWIKVPHSVKLFGSFILGSNATGELTHGVFERLISGSADWQQITIGRDQLITDPLFPTPDFVDTMILGFSGVQPVDFDIAMTCFAFDGVVFESFVAYSSSTDLRSVWDSHIPDYPKFDNADVIFTRNLNRHRFDPFVGEFAKGDPLTGAHYGVEVRRLVPPKGCRNVWTDYVYADQKLCLGVPVRKKAYEFSAPGCLCAPSPIIQDIADLITDPIMSHILADDGAHGPFDSPEGISFEYCHPVDHQYKRFGSKSPTANGRVYWAGGGRPDPVIDPMQPLWTRVWTGPGSALVSGRETYVVTDALLFGVGSHEFTVVPNGTVGFSVGMPVWVRNSCFFPDTKREITCCDIDIGDIAGIGECRRIASPAITLPFGSLVAMELTTQGAVATTAFRDVDPLDWTAGWTSDMDFDFRADVSGTLIIRLVDAAGKQTQITRAHVGSVVFLHYNILKTEFVTNAEVGFSFATVKTFHVIYSGMPVTDPTKKVVIDEIFIDFGLGTVQTVDTFETYASTSALELVWTCSSFALANVAGAYGVITALDGILNKITVEFYAETTAEFTVGARAEILVSPANAKGFYWEASPDLIALAMSIPIDDPEFGELFIRWGYRFWQSRLAGCGSDPYQPPATLIYNGNGEIKDFPIAGDREREVINPIEWRTKWCSPVVDLGLLTDAPAGTRAIHVCSPELFRSCDVIGLIDDRYPGMCFYATVCAVDIPNGFVVLLNPIPMQVRGFPAFDGFKAGTGGFAKIFKHTVQDYYMKSPSAITSPIGIPLEGADFVGVNFDTGEFVFTPFDTSLRVCVFFRALHTKVQLPCQDGTYRLIPVDETGCEGEASEAVTVIS